MQDEYTEQTHQLNQPHEGKSQKIPSRASSGASSSGYLHYRQSRPGGTLENNRRNNDGPGPGGGGASQNNNNSHSGHSNSHTMTVASSGRPNDNTELSSDEGTGEEINENRQESLWEEQLMHESLTEADLWQIQVKDHPKLPTSITDMETKRQETIYEFIKTERSHLKNLQLMKNVWWKGLYQKHFKHIHMDKLLPALDGMIFQSRKFLLTIHERQADQYPMIEHIGDCIAKYWIEEQDHIVLVFGSFCSLHQEALSYYKELMNEDKIFAKFIVNTRTAGNTRRLDLPDCMQLAMQRITKYQLMVSKIKERTKGRENERRNLDLAVTQIMKIAERVDQQVKFVSREKRLEEICKKLESKGKAVTVGRKDSFGRDDMKYNKRRLLFESKASVKAQSKPNKKAKDPADVVLLLMTDYVVMLKTNARLMSDGFNYAFLNLSSGQPTVLPLRGLIVRENPTNENERYILSAKYVEMGLYELNFKSADKATVFAEQVRLAASNCPDVPIDEGAGSDEEKARVRKREQQRIELRFAKCNDLLTKIRETETQIITMTNEKINMSNELRAITTNQDTQNPENSANPQIENLVNCVEDGQQCSPLIRNCQKLTKELTRSEIQEKLSDTLATAFTVSTHQETEISRLETDNARLSVVGHTGRESKDLNQMERFHEIESKRFDRQRKKEREELRKEQINLDYAKRELDESRKQMDVERADIDRQKDELEKERNRLLRELQEKNKTLADALHLKNQEHQVNLLKIRDMQRQLDEANAKLHSHGHNVVPSSPKSHHSASPGSSFSKADLGSVGSGQSGSNKRSNSHGASDGKPVSVAELYQQAQQKKIERDAAAAVFVNNNSSNLRRGDSLSPDRSSKLRHKKSDTHSDSSSRSHNFPSAYSTSNHHRSISSLSSKLAATTVSPQSIATNPQTSIQSNASTTQQQPPTADSGMLLPLQLSSASASTITDKIHLAHLPISENDKHMLGVKNESTIKRGLAHSASNLPPQSNHESDKKKRSSSFNKGKKGGDLQAKDSRSGNSKDPSDVYFC